MININMIKQDIAKNFKRKREGERGERESERGREGEIERGNTLYLGIFLNDLL